MANVFIEPLPKGREHNAITGYAVEEAGDRVLSKCRTQEEAIEWAKRNGHTPHVARVRHTDKGNPDHWRKV